MGALCEARSPQDFSAAAAVEPAGMPRQRGSHRSLDQGVVRTLCRRDRRRVLRRGEPIHSTDF